MTKREKSSSHVQQEAEAELIAHMATILEVTLQKKVFTFETEKVEVDGVSEGDTRLVLVEAYARVGELKAAQKNKVRGDILKLLLVRDAQKREFSCETHFVFASEEAAKYLTGKSWVARAARNLLGAKVHVASLSEELVERIKQTQRDQDLRV